MWKKDDINVNKETEMEKTGIIIDYNDKSDEKSTYRNHACTKTTAAYLMWTATV